MFPIVNLQKLFASCFFFNSEHENVT